MTLDRRQVLSGIAAAGLAAVAGCSKKSTPRTSTKTTPTTSPSATSPATPSPSATPSSASPALETIASGLNVPWGIAFLASGDALVSERDKGRILRVSPNGKTSTLLTVPGVDLTGGSSEGGLLGLVLTADRSTLFAYFSTERDNRIVSMSFDGEKLGDPTPILTGIPRGTHHNGGRLVIGSDNLLYASTGETEVRELAQNRDSLGGKILRLTLEGKPAPGNPFDNEVWTWGHRNVEGLAFDAQSRLWATEFGDRSFDELNLIERGNNYGWPQTEGKTDAAGITSPKVTWPTEECSPSGIAIVGSTAYIGALRGECMFTVGLSGTSAGKPKRRFAGKYGRVRSMAAAPDGSVWMTTSNTDGRATPSKSDDRIVRVRVNA